jgi:hypothetical protein
MDGELGRLLVMHRLSRRPFRGGSLGREVAYTHPPPINSGGGASRPALKRHARVIALLIRCSPHDSLPRKHRGMIVKDGRWRA